MSQLGIAGGGRRYDPKDWLGPNRTGDLTVQVLRQEEGYSIILLHLPE